MDAELALRIVSEVPFSYMESDGSVSDDPHEAFHHGFRHCRDRILAEMQLVISEIGHDY